MERYNRQIVLSDFGIIGQEKLKKSSVAIIGAGALGSLVAMHLSAAGVGKIILCDNDTVSVSNLHRQLFYNEKEVGQSKVECLTKSMMAINSNVEVIAINKLIKDQDLKLLLSDCDFVVDGSDNPLTKYMVADVCDSRNVPYCIGGVREYIGQVMTHLPGTSSYRDVFLHQFQLIFAQTIQLVSLDLFRALLQASNLLKLLNI